MHCFVTSQQMNYRRAGIQAAFILLQYFLSRCNQSSTNIEWDVFLSAHITATDVRIGAQEYFLLYYYLLIVGKVLKVSSSYFNINIYRYIDPVTLQIFSSYCYFRRSMLLCVIIALSLAYSKSRVTCLVPVTNLIFIFVPPRGVTLIKSKPPSSACSLLTSDRFLGDSQRWL